MKVVGCQSSVVGKELKVLSAELKVNGVMIYVH